jgi:hypothetical protein
MKEEMLEDMTVVDNETQLYVQRFMEHLRILEKELL